MANALTPASVSSANPPASSRLFNWPHETTAAEGQTLVAGGLGWMLDAMDVMLYSLVIAFLMREFAMDTRTAGFLNSLTLVASAIGGLVFGGGQPCVRILAFHNGVGGVPVFVRHRYGWRMDRRRGADSRNMAARTPRESPGAGGVFV